MDLFFRKIVRDKGQALTKLLTEIQELAKGDEGNGALQAERELLAKGLEDVQGIVATMVGSLTASADDVTNIYKVGQNTSRLLLAVGDLVTAWLLLRQAAVAWRRSRRARPGATSSSTRARSPQRGSSPRRPCRCSARSVSWRSRWTTT